MSSVLLTKAFYVAASVRLVKTFAQSLVALLTANGLGVVDIDWGGTLSIAAMAALLSFLTSVASADNIVQPPDPPPPTQ